MAMEKFENALWRIEFRTDETSASSPVITLGYMLEAMWKDGARWLGMTFRSTLMPLEHDLVNFDTWHELQDLDGFMRQVFNETWSSATVHELSSASMAAKFPHYSALNFTSESVLIDAKGSDESEMYVKLYEHLVKLQPMLEPKFLAEVFDMNAVPKKQKPIASSKTKFEILNQAA